MSLDDWRTVFFSTCLIMVLIILSPILMHFSPQHVGEGGFISMAVLGDGMKTDNYFPNNFPFIQKDQNITWNIVTSNQMSNSQYVLIKIKFLDSRPLAPNNTLGMPSPVLPVYETRRILSKNETIVIPFQWSISSITIYPDHREITKMRFNGDPTDLRVDVSNTSMLRLILELWVYDEASNTFRFDWNTDSQNPKIVWNQIWFNVYN